MQLRLIAFLLFSGMVLNGLSMHGQNPHDRDSTKSHQLFVSADLWGVTVQPLIKSFYSLDGHVRYLGKVQYIYDEKLAFDFVYGQDRVLINEEDKSFEFKKSNATFKQLHLKMLLYSEKKARLSVGIGSIFGRLKSSGHLVNTINGGGTTNEKTLLSEHFHGWIGSLNLDYNLTPRLSLVLENKFQGITVPNSTDVPYIFYNPSGGKSLIKHKESALGFHRSILVKFRLF